MPTVPRSSAARGSALAFVLLVLVTAFAGAALPRLVDAYETEGLRQSLARAQPEDRLLSGTAQASPPDEADGDGDPRQRVLPPSVSSAAAAFRSAPAAPLRIDRAGAAYGVRNRTPALAGDPGLPRSSPSLPPRATLLTQQHLGKHSRLTEGAMPGRAIRGRPGERVVEAVLTTRTARTMKLATGDSFHLQGASGLTTVRVTGLITPRGERSGAYWTAVPGAGRAEPVSVPPSAPGDTTHHYWQFAAFLNPEATPALLELRDGAELFWSFPLLTHTLHAYEVPGMLQQLTSLSAGVGAARLEEQAQIGHITLDDSLSGVLDAYSREQAALSPLLLFASLGLGTAMVIVLVLSSVLTAERRRSEFDLLRSRGGSLPGIAGRLLAETSTLALPAAAVGSAVALLCTPAGRLGTSLFQAAGVTAVALLALPLRAALAHRSPLNGGGRRSDLARAHPSRRRRVLELAVLTLLLGAVLALRTRGMSTDGEADPLLASTPVLLAMAVTLVLLRAFPLPLRLLSRRAAHRTGVVAFVGMARAGRARAGATTGLMLLALLVTLTLASFGGTVLAGVAHGRDTAALRTVGADVRIAAPELGELPAHMASRVSGTAGVDGVAAFRLHDDGEVVSGDKNVTLIIADAPSYARLAARTGRGAFPPGALAARSAGGPVPALASPGVARQFGGKAGPGRQIEVPGLSIAVRTALVRDETPGSAEGEFLVISADAVARTHPGTSGTALLAPDTLLATGGAPDTAALRELTRGEDVDLLLRTTERTMYQDSVLQTGAQQLYLAVILATSAFSALAVLLSLLQTAPERVTLLARLRTMGLPKRQGRGVLILESLPLYVLTAASGALAGLLAVPLLGPGIDLGALAGTPGTVPVHLTADPASVLLPPFLLLVLLWAGLLAQAHLATRRTSTDELRMEPL